VSRNGKSLQAIIAAEVREHNRRLRDLETGQVGIKTDTSWLKEQYKKIDYRIWAMIMFMLAGLVSSILTLLKG